MNTLSRREMLRLAALGIGGTAASGWLPVLANASAGKHKSCILLWMDGGPSQHDTFDMKPNASEQYRGEYRPIPTSVPGVQITHALPRLARLMHHGTIIRSMSTGEAEHGRARTYLHTGYKPGAGGLLYPTMGSMLSAGRQEEADREMPNFVVTGKHLNPANWSYVSSPGHLGPRHAPLIVANPAGGVANLRSTVEQTEQSERLDLLQEMTAGFLRERPVAQATAQQTMVQRAVRLMRSSRSQAFELNREPARTREIYGDHAFGQGCLLARRLVEVGVPFVEVYHAPTPGGWDSHTGVRAKEVKEQALPQLDQGMSALLADLHDRGMLRDTLVIWMGEFGRTPIVKRDGGRDHYARAWTTALFGGGIRAGGVVGRTDANGVAVVDRPVSAVDFMSTVCKILGVREEQNFRVGDRPVRMIDRGARPITEVLG